MRQVFTVEPGPEAGLKASSRVSQQAVRLRSRHVSFRRRGRVVIAGDDAGYCATLADALHRLGYGAEAVAPSELDDLVAASAPDAIVFVVESFPVGARDRWVLALGELDSPFVCVLHTDRLADRLAAFEAGADDVIVRPVAIPELDARLQVVFRRHAPDRSTLEVGDLVVDVRAHVAIRNDTPLDLTSLEFAILALLIRNQGSVLSKGRMLQEIWGFDQVDENVVEVHISALRRKLEQHGPRLIHTIRGAGYVLRPAMDDPSIRLVVS